MFCVIAFNLAAYGIAAGDVFAPVKQRLVQEGFDKKRVSTVFQTESDPLFKVVYSTFRIQESKLNYGQFLQPAALAKAQQFMRTHEKTLKEAEAAYGVNRSVIVAILLVETQLGGYTGKTPTLGILSTFALMDQDVYRDRIWSMLSAGEQAHWGREAFDRKLLSRSQWAYGELRALIKLSETQGLRVESLKGSVMGAIGWAQFLPSSLVRYGVDGNKDGRIDLYHPVDAIFSIANYLREHGWARASTQEEREKVIHHYNRSRPYVSAVLGVADRLRP
jgi:membrane-bound lytic murein transglycosylase B